MFSTRIVITFCIISLFAGVIITAMLVNKGPVCYICGNRPSAVEYYDEGKKYLCGDCWDTVNESRKRLVKSKIIEENQIIKHEVITGLESLIEDRKSFIVPGEQNKDLNAIWEKDIKMLEMAIELIK